MMTMVVTMTITMTVTIMTARNEATLLTRYWNDNFIRR